MQVKKQEVKGQVGKKGKEEDSFDLPCQEYGKSCHKQCSTGMHGARGSWEGKSEEAILLWSPLHRTPVFSKPASV